MFTIAHSAMTPTADPIRVGLLSLSIQRTTRMLERSVRARFAPECRRWAMRGPELPPSRTSCRWGHRPPRFGQVPEFRAALLLTRRLALLRFTLSYPDVEELLAERGLDTVRRAVIVRAAIHASVIQEGQLFATLRRISQSISAPEMGDAGSRKSSVERWSPSIAQAPPSPRSSAPTRRC